MQMILKKCLL